MHALDLKPKTLQQATQDARMPKSPARIAPAYGSRSILDLQRIAGNQAVLRILRTDPNNSQNTSAGTTAPPVARDRHPNSWNIRAAAVTDPLRAHDTPRGNQQSGTEVAIKRAPDATSKDTSAERAKSPDDAEEQAAAQEVSIKESLSPKDLELRTNALDLVAGNFNWIKDNIGLHFDELRADLLKEDEPTWSEELLGSLVDVALLASASSFGMAFAVKYAAKLLPLERAAKPLKEGGQEFVKSLVDQGTGKGIDAGRKALKGGSNKDVIERFILSQRQGAITMYHENYDSFLRIGRHQVKTVEAAKALREASNEEFQEAPEIQYRKALDAWVSYLAQARFGVKESNDSGHSTATTDMANQERRDHPSHFEWGHGVDIYHYGGKGQNPRTAPNMNQALHGGDAGVLHIWALLPAITGRWAKNALVDIHMDGLPKVRVAILNGVNADIRKHYEGKALSALQIPRQVSAQVDGETPNFTLNIDEVGGVEKYNQDEEWLDNRALLADPATISRPRFLRVKEGIKLLLDDLVPRTIAKGL